MGNQHDIPSQSAESPHESIGLDRIRFSHGHPKESLTEVILKEMAAETRSTGSSFVAQVPIHFYKHGDSWSGYTHGDDGATKWVGKMDVHSTHAQINFSDMAEFNLDALIAFRDQLVSQFTASMEKELVETLHSAVADRAPVDLNLSGDPREGLKRMWTDIKIGLDKHLQLNQPMVLMDPASMKKLKEAQERLERDHPEFSQEIAELRRKKHIEALIEHFENLKKFKIDDTDHRTIDDMLLRLRESE